jgi:hypothetical protein
MVENYCKKQKFNFQMGFVKKPNKPTHVIPEMIN